MKTELVFGLRWEAKRHAALETTSHFRKAVSLLRSAIAIQKVLPLLLCLLVFIPAAARPATNNLTSLLQQGLFEEQANRNLDAAITDYQSLATQFDKDRKIAATAVFRLGECYRVQGKTNEAAAQYQRILRDFPDQTTLVTLSRQDLAGMGFESNPTAMTVSAQNRTPSLEERAEIQRIQTMIQNSPDLINGPDSHGHTPLELAVINGWFKAVAFLLDHGADVNARGGAALIDAAQAGNRAMVEFLLAHGANINENGGGRTPTPLFTAVQHRFEAVTATLLTNKADANVSNSQGDTPLMWAIQSGPDSIVQMLLAAGANVNAENNQGRTPLSFAAERPWPELVKKLLDAKADPNAGKLDAPLLCAIHEKNVTVARLLLEAGANPNAKGTVDWRIKIGNEIYGGGAQITPLWLAIDSDEFPMVQLLLKYKADPNDSQTDGRSVLFNALAHTNILAALVDAGATVDVRDTTQPFPQGKASNETPLLAAVQNPSDAESVNILLKRGANPNARTLQGNTPLHLAAYNLPNSNVFNALIDHKAQLNVRNHEGETPLDILKKVATNSNYGGYSLAQRKLAGKLADLLRQHGALDNLPDWDAIKFSLPFANLSDIVFRKGTNNWNHFTLLELIHDESGNLSFADFGHIVIVRPNTNNVTSKRIKVNLLNATNGVDCAKDLPLKFGDTVEFPEREHTLAQQDNWTPEQIRKITAYLQDHVGTAKLIVAGGQTIELPLKYFEPGNCWIGTVLDSSLARNVLTSDSDLSRVQVTRRDSKTGKTHKWTLDCSNHQKSPNLWLRNGDVIEVPEKP